MLERCNDLQQAPLLAIGLLCYTVQMGRMLGLLLNGPLGVTCPRQAV